MLASRAVKVPPRGVLVAVAGATAAVLSVLAADALLRRRRRRCRCLSPPDSRALLPDPKTLVEFDGSIDHHAYCNARSEKPIRLAKKGLAALPPVTVLEVFHRAVAEGGDRPALRVERGRQGWEMLSWTRYGESVHLAARALITLGVKQFGSVAVLGGNSPEWFIAALAAAHVGAKAAGIYATNQPAAATFVVDHCKALVVFTEDASQTAKLLASGEYAKLPHLTTIVQWTGDGRLAPQGQGQGQGEAGQQRKAGPPEPHLISWNAFMGLAQGTPESALADRMACVKPGHCASLIYTSGTTGNPKAVMVSHDNLTWTTRAVMHHIRETGFGSGADEHLVSYLPLSHIAAQLLDMHAPMAITAAAASEAGPEEGEGESAASAPPKKEKGRVDRRSPCCCVSFARPDALRGSLGATLREVRPTAFLGVPRVWEKIGEKLKELGAQVKSPALRRLSQWAKATSAAQVAWEECGAVEQKEPPSPLAHALAKALVLSKVHKGLGLDRCKLFGTAAAPLASSTWKYFASLGVRIMDLYGMSECTGPQTCALPSSFQLGCCGRQLEGCEMKLDYQKGRDPPGEGEIWYRGRHVMMGYLDDSSKTQEALDQWGGWLKSGDVGAVTPDGLLKITGRVKELLITAGGENVAPVPIEDALKALLPFCANLMVVGDRRKYLSLLATPFVEPSGLSGQPDLPSDRLAGPSKLVDPSALTALEARKSEAWRDALLSSVEAYNSSAACVSRAQRIVTVALLASDFSVAGGELTPTHKLKRAFTANKYRDVIETELYGGGDMPARKGSKQSAFDLKQG